MTAPRVRWEVRSVAGTESQWATHEGAVTTRDWRRAQGATCWIVKVTTHPKRVTRRTWRRGNTVVRWIDEQSCTLQIIKDDRFIGCVGIALSDDVRAEAIRMLDEREARGLIDQYAPRKAGAR